MMRRWKPGAPALAAVITMSAFSAGATGCHNTNVTTAAPPTVACGTVLSSGPMGAVLFDATRRLPVVKYPTVRNGAEVLMFRVARGCDKGTHVTWVPLPAAHLVTAAYARDGQIVAVVLKPSRPHAAFRLIGTQNGKVVASATVKLAS